MTAAALPSERGQALAWGMLLVLALAIYALGLGNPYIPTNGDEMVYAHIARLTAASGHWLPLVSELDNMRNTKPPLLFWQALWASDWGRHWSLAALRTPSLVYTMLLAAMVAATVHGITRSLARAALAACVYLAFFSTFRYGRPFLTSAPETFWLSLPMFWLLWQRLSQPPGAKHAADAGPGWWAHAAFGIAFGLGLAYKSFALIAPAAAALWCARLATEPQLSRRVLWRASLQVTCSAGLALALFGLWFVLDPDPGAVWQEFVLAENAGKMASTEGYWHVALRGGDGSMLAQLLAYVQNAGLLAFVVLGLLPVALAGWRRSNRAGGAAQPKPPALPAHTMILLVWLGVWLLVFLLPSQRSARYVIPAMPALACLVALYWHRIGRIWFVLCLPLCALLLLLLGRIAWVAHGLGIASSGEWLAAMAAALSGLLLVLAGAWRANWSRACSLAACLAVYACLGLSTAPLKGPAGRYPAEALAALGRHDAQSPTGASVAVPNNFNGQFERFEFLLPGHRFVPYDSEARVSTTPDGATLANLLARHDAVVWLQGTPTETTPPCAPSCPLLGTRWELKGRHRSGEITLANVWYPQEWLFRREWLVRRQAEPVGFAPVKVAPG